MLGNDFLPHFPSINIRTIGIDRLMSSYQSNKNSKKLSFDKAETMKINWRNLRQFILILSENERNIFIQEEERRLKLENTSFKPRIGDNLELCNKLNNIPIKERVIEKYVNPCEDDWEWRYYKALFDVESNDTERRKEICINYLEG